MNKVILTSARGCKIFVSLGFWAPSALPTLGVRQLTLDFQGFGLVKVGSHLTPAKSSQLRVSTVAKYSCQNTSSVPQRSRTWDPARIWHSHGFLGILPKQPGYNHIQEQQPSMPPAVGYMFNGYYLYIMHMHVYIYICTHMY